MRKKAEREKRSPVWTIPREELITIVNQCGSLAEILRHLGYGHGGATASVLKKRLVADNIDFSHIKLGYNSNIGRNFNFKMSKEECLETLCNDTKIHPSFNTLKSYIIHYDLIKYECQRCKNSGIWNDEKLTLQLDHINGNKYNNKLENLRFLCPNCHSQTETFGSKNRSKDREKNKEMYIASKKYIQKTKCLSCSKEIDDANITGKCRRCFNIDHRNVERILTKEQVESIIWTKPLSALAQDFNCSANGLKKFCYRHGIQIAPKGYWVRRSRGYSHEDALKSQKKYRIPKNYLLQPEIDEIKAMLEKGHTINDTSRTFKRDRKIVRRIKEGTYVPTLRLSRKNNINN